MSINLLDLVQSQLGGGLMGQIAGALGESEEGTSKAMGAAMPALLGGIMQKAKGAGNANFLMDMVSSGGHDGGIFDKLPGMLGGGGDKGAGLMGIGGPMIEGLLGNKMGGIVDMIGSVSGMGKSGSSSMLKMAGPLLMGVIGKQVKTGGLDAGGLMKMVMGQGSFLKGMAPSGLAGILGLGKIDDLVGDALGAVTGAAGAAAGAVGSAASGAANLAGGAVSGAAGLAGDAAGKAADLAGGAANKVGDAAGAAAGAGKAAAGAVGNMANAAADTAGDAAKSGGNMLMKILPIALLVLVGGFLLARMGCKNPAGDAANAVGAGAAGLAGDAADAAGNAASGAVDLAGNAVDAAGNAVDAVGDAAGSAVDAAGNVAGAAVDAAGNAAGSAVDAAGNAVDAAGKAAGSVVGAVRSIKLPTGGDLEIKGGSTEDVLYTYLNDSKAAVGQSFTFDDLRFERNSPEVQASSHAQLDRVVAILNAYPSVKFRIEGHTDNVGDAEANMNLSRARAENTKVYLLKKGIKTTRVTTKGYGDTKPVATNDTDAGKAANRRTVLIISEK